MKMSQYKIDKTCFRPHYPVAIQPKVKKTSRLVLGTQKNCPDV